MMPLILFGVTVAPVASAAPFALWTLSASFTFLAATAWVVMLLLIAVAVRANWGAPKYLPRWLVAVIVIAIGGLLVIAFVSNSTYVAMTALYASVAMWLLYLFSWTFPRVPGLHEHADTNPDSESPADQNSHP
jgi:hypothetical protein